MVVFLNGRFVPEEQALVSVFDRAFLYGDGLFETLRIANRIPFRWNEHWERLERGAGFLGISIPFRSEALRCALEQLLQENGMSDALLRVTLSRGTGVRGYSPKGAHEPFLVMSLHPAPALSSIELRQWQLVTASFRLPINDPLAQYKTCNKLPQVLARAQADAANVQEALLVNTDGHIVEGTSSNLFWVAGATVCTPPLSSGILAGVTRSVVLELCQKLNLPMHQTDVKPEQLFTADGVFLSLSSFGIVEATALDGRCLHRSPITAQIGKAYLRLLHAEPSVVSRISLRIDSV